MIERKFHSLNSECLLVQATGSNGCVGLLGPALGGGLGRYQGQYGLISDNFVSLNVVLANGTETIVSAKSNSDLFWAMKGAGHNFGIVTSAYIKIYPRKASTWHYHNYVWSQDKLEKVFGALNKFQGKGQIPALMGVNFGQFSIEPSISKTEVSLETDLTMRESRESKLTRHRPSSSGRLPTMVPLQMRKSC